MERSERLFDRLSSALICDGEDGSEIVIRGEGLGGIDFHLGDIVIEEESIAAALGTEEVGELKEIGIPGLAELGNRKEHAPIGKDADAVAMEIARGGSAEGRMRLSVPQKQRARLNRKPGLRISPGIVAGRDDMGDAVIIDIEDTVRLKEEIPTTG